MTAIREPGALQEKDPNSIEPYGFNWTDWLNEISTAEIITGSSWAVSPAGLTLSSASIVTGSRQTQVKATGGVEGVEYKVTNTITTTSGYKDDRSFTVLGVEK